MVWPQGDVDLFLAGFSYCSAELNGDGVLDLFDFLEFVNAFNGGNLRADCADDGLLDLFDVLCFTNMFNEGCD